MEMKYDLAVKIMDDVVKGYLKDMQGMLDEVGATEKDHDDLIREVYTAYSRIRNG